MLCASCPLVLLPMLPLALLSLLLLLLSLVALARRLLPPTAARTSPSRSAQLTNQALDGLAEHIHKARPEGACHDEQHLQRQQQMGRQA